MPFCLFASDIHGSTERYRKLVHAIAVRAPDAVFLGGDLTPFPGARATFGAAPTPHFLRDYLVARFEELRSTMKARYPRVFIILGNDDARAFEADAIFGEKSGVWTYCHERHVSFGAYDVYGYAFVPPSPFQLKDWERYDVSRYVPPGCVSPEQGRRSVEVDAYTVRHATIQKDLEALVGEDALDRAIMLFHAPPHSTALDLVDNDGKMVEHVPLDVNVGSIAVRRMIEERQPLITLHGHIHESARLTGRWRDTLGRTHIFSAAHDGQELSLVSFDVARPQDAVRELI